MSRHYSEDDLTLYYYGEGRRRAAIDAHLANCASCASLYREISGTLALVAPTQVPARSDRYGLEVWQRIRGRLDEEPGFTRFARFTGFSRFGFSWFSWNRVALVGAAAVLIIAAFIAGRIWRTPATPMTAANVANPANPVNRVLLTALADHLDQSERVLTDIMNAPDAGTPNQREDISAEQRWAEDLLTTSRLYRQDAVAAGEQSVATVLDDLERSLLEIVHSPSKIGAAELEQIRRRIDAAALLFKVRVMSDELRRREATPIDRSSSRTTTSKTS